MVKERTANFLFAADADELDPGVKRAMFYIWNIAALLLSSAVVASASLLLAYGVDSDVYGRMVFTNYFQHPSIFLLNWLPVLLFQLLMLSVFGRQWAAYLASSLLFLTASIGHFYKMRLRYEPFVFSDIQFIGAALGVAGNYDLSPGLRVLTVAAAVPLGTLLMALLVRGRPCGRMRLVTPVVLALSVYPLWRFVYSSDKIYNDTSVLSKITVIAWDQQFSVGKGFVYPFIHSIKDVSGTAPDGYDKAQARALISQYDDAPIPEDRRVNLLVFQLEAFSDLTRTGISGIAPEVYEQYHRLEEESFRGNLICNVSGGTTINTERCFLTGNYSLNSYSKKSYSHVWYLRSQGYAVTGGHPYLMSYYSRSGVNPTLGFESYSYLDSPYDSSLAYGTWFPDSVFFPTVLGQFHEAADQGKPVFSFNVTMQGHGPYDWETLKYDDISWQSEGCSEYAYNVMNNYLGSVRDTQTQLAAMFDELREDGMPVVVLLYGDHKPWLGDNASVLKELGVNINPSTEDGFLNYYSTRYLIWANDAAKAMLGDGFTGEGPDVSAGFLMNLLFEKLGWPGSAYIQFGDDVRRQLQVVTSNGYYYEDGALTSDLSSEGREAFKKLSWVQYYLNHNYENPIEE